jgi:hypothetical protein
MAFHPARAAPRTACPFCLSNILLRRIFLAAVIALAVKTLAYDLNW